MQQTMQAITAALLAAALGFALAWYFGHIEGNFSLSLFVASLVTGLYWLAEKLYFYPQRQKAAAVLQANDQRRRAELAKAGIDQVDGDISEAKTRLLMQPWWLDWTAGLFPVIVTVFLLRSFLFEPFKIPSGSMIPTLMIGDLILVNKFTYGLRLPVMHTRLTEGNKPQRGDVMVFRYPPKPSLDYIKRVVGVPGDTVAYLNKQLSINGKPVPKAALPDFLDDDTMRYSKQYEEVVSPVEGSGDAKKHLLLNDLDRPAFVPGAEPFAFAENCQYTVEGVTCKVPDGHYFMMGDNRDNSLDSRYWGFVPEQNIVGKAFLVWMNFGNLQRIGRFE